MKVLMILFFLFIDNLAIGQYPFLPQNQQHYINGTVGEERGNRQRYHYGLDFAKAQNTKVYAIESGIFHIVNGSCTVGHFGYVHVTNHQKIEGDSVTIGTYIGDVNCQVHVHLQQSSVLLDNVSGYEGSNGWINPISFLIPLDNQKPRIENARLFRDNNHDIDVTNNAILFGNIDILVDTEDHRINPNGSGNGYGTAPHKISWELFDSSNTLEINDGISFDQVPPNASANTVLGSASAWGVPNFEYWITHDPFQTPYDKYWNVRQLNSGTYNSNATCPENAKLKDHKVQIRVKSCDFNDSCTTLLLPSISGHYQIDNFKPYIASVSMAVKGKQCYQAGWDCDNCGGIKYSNTVNSVYELDSLKLQGMRISAKSSEPLALLRLNIPFYNISNLLPIVVSQDSMQFTFETGPINNFNISATKELQFTGTDFGGNQLLKLEGFKSSSCVSVPIRTGANSFSNSSNVPFGSDLSYDLPCTHIKSKSLVIDYPPTDCNLADGRICVKNVKFEGGFPDYKSRLEDESGNILPKGFCYDHLKAGKYYYIGTDSTGCDSQIELHELKAPNSPELYSEVYPDCTGKSVGSIGIGVTNPGGSWAKSTFVWDNGQIFSGDNNMQIEGLSEGKYCVTITTDSSQCVVNNCYIVGKISAPYPEFIKIDKTNPCPYMANGAIVIQAKSNFPTSPLDLSGLSYKWEDNSVTTHNFKNNISDGLKCFSITDYCLQKIDTCLIFQSLKDSFSLKPGCERGEAICNTFGGNSPYSYKWDSKLYQYSSKDNKVYDAVSDIYKVSITDAKGCKLTDSVELHNTGVELEIIKPCLGSNDGEVIFHIYNVEGKESKLVYKRPGSQTIKDTILIQEGIKHFDFTIGGIIEGYLNVWLETGSCKISFSQKIESLPSIKEFVKNIGDTCFYNVSCKGNSVSPPGEYIKEFVTKKYEGYGQGGFFGLLDACELRLFCDTTQIGVKEGKYLTWKIGKYINLLNMVLGQEKEFLQQDWQNILNLLANHDDCDNVTFCNLTLLPKEDSYDVWKLSSFGIGGNDPKYEVINEHCVRVKCPGWFNDYTLCNDDPSLLELANKIVGGANQTNADFRNCNFKTYNIYQLLIWKDSLNNASNFVGSQLDSFLTSHSNNKKALCGEVTFCKNNFQVLHSDISIIDCESIEVVVPSSNSTDSIVCNIDHFCTLDTSFYCTSTGYVASIKILCKKKKCGNFDVESDYCQYFCRETNLIKPLNGYSKGFLRQTNIGNNVAVTDMSDEHPTYFDDFAFVRSDSVVLVKGLFRNNRTSEFYNYLPQKENLQTEKIPLPVVFHFFDMDSINQVTIFEKIKGKEYSFLYSSNNLNFEQVFSSSTNITIDGSLRRSNYTQCIGRFENNLSFNDSILYTLPGHNLFYTEILDNGSISNIHVIKNISSKPKITELNDGIKLEFKSKLGSIILDGVTYQSLSIDSSFSLKVNLLGEIQPVMSTFQTVGEIKVIKSSFDKISKRTSYLFSGTGKIYFNNQYLNEIVNSTNLVTLDSLNTILWQSHFTNLILTDSLCDLANNIFGEVILAFSSTNDYEFNGQQERNQGGADINFYSFNRFGTFKKVSFASRDNETVRKIYTIADIIFFGGTYNSDSSSTYIGHNEFLNLCINKSQAYMTYINSNDFTEQPAPIQASIKKYNNDISEFYIFPNPTTSNLNFQFSKVIEGELYINILSSTGKQVMNTKININSLTEISIPNFSDLDPGIYFIEVYLNGERNGVNKIVKLR